MPHLAIIGGTGLTSLKTLKISNQEVIVTPYGEPSGPITHGELGNKHVLFIPRHGSGHTIPPHKINYRANIWALHELGVKHVVAVAAVGGIQKNLTNAQVVIPDQIIDYTYSRINTYFEEGLNNVTHIDFSYPYCAELRDRLLQAGQLANLELHDGATYGAVQGPRLETAAEIDRLERDGCHIVGMTGMPEAALARELGICYATCAVVANAAAGRGDGEITMTDIETNLKNGIKKVRTLLQRLITLI